MRSASAVCFFSVISRKVTTEPTSCPSRLIGKDRYSLIQTFFRSKSELVGVAEVYSSSIETLDIWDERLPEYEMFGTGILVKFKARITRGT